MSANTELLAMLNDDTLALRVDMLMLRLFCERDSIEESKEVIDDYIDRVCGYIEQHCTDISVISSALCACLIPDKVDLLESTPFIPLIERGA